MSPLMPSAGQRRPLSLGHLRSLPVFHSRHQARPPRGCPQSAGSDASAPWKHPPSHPHSPWAARVPVKQTYDINRHTR